MLYWLISVFSLMNNVGASLVTGKPGLTVTVSSTGLQYASRVALETMGPRFQGRSIPDQHGSADTPVGDVDYDVTGMTVTSLTIPESNVAVQPGNDVTWSLRNGGLSIHGDWHYDYLFVSDGGDFDLSVSGIDVTASMTIGLGEGGRPTLRTGSCSCGVDDVDVDIHGGASWLYDLFKGDIEDKVADSLRDMLCKEVRHGIDVDAEAALKRIKVQAPIWHSPVVIDYRLVAPPVFGRGYLKTSHKGEFFFGPDQSEAPFQPGPIIEPHVTDRMVTICMADYVGNTLGYVLNKYKLLKHNVTPKDLPASRRGFLNTTCHGQPCIGTVIPQLGQHFPNCTVEIFGQTTCAPNVCTSPEGIGGKINGTVSFNVRKPDGSVKLGFSTQTVVDASGSVNVSAKDRKRITGRVNKLSVKLAVIKSNVGHISDALLNTMASLAVKTVLLPEINVKLQKGFVLPTIDNVTLNDLEFHQMKGGICVSLNAIYRALSQWLWMIQL